MSYGLTGHAARRTLHAERNDVTPTLKSSFRSSDVETGAR
jgi:hypothetical protein